MENFLPPFSWTNLLIIPALLVGYTGHELGHALMAYWLGDYSQVERGKITLNPFEHISWIGLVAFLIFGIGWPKPLQANPQHFKHKYRDMFLVAVTGPFVSLTLSLGGFLLTLVIAAAAVYTSGVSTDRLLPFFFPLAAQMPHTLNLQAWTIALTGYLAIANFWLTLVSLLPLPGLDGFTAVVSLVAHFSGRGDDPAQPDSPPRPTTDPLRLSEQQQRRRNKAASIHFEVGVDYHQQGQYEDAIARYRQAINNDVNFGPAYINLGLAYLGKGRRKEAIHAFRGAIQYADDQKSRSEAWQQLHQLSDVSPIDEQVALESMSQMGAAPWTDTKPRPNWVGLGIGGGFLLLCSLVLYGYLFIQLIEFLQA